MREIKARYKQSFLGFFWIILNPFFLMLIMSFVFEKILRFGDLGVPYPLFLFVGLLPWGFLNTTFTTSMTVMIDNSSLIKKIYFPREILVLSNLFAKTVDFFIAALIFVGLMIWFQQPVDWHLLLFFPIFLLQMGFVYGVSLMLSVMNLLYRDVQYFFTLLLTLWFYLTPIVYPVEIFPERYRWIFQINPMSVFTNAYRQVLLARDLPNWSSLLIGLGMTVILILIAHYFFRKTEQVIADIV
jgi:ABC-type polysaccharide/polyol phosphate export permease